MDIKELYQDIILDHGKNPRNKNKCKDFNKDAKGHNPLCGDKVHVYIKLDKEKKVEQNTGKKAFEELKKRVEKNQSKLYSQLILGRITQS